MTGGCAFSWNPFTVFELSVTNIELSQYKVKPQFKPASTGGPLCLRWASLSQGLIHTGHATRHANWNIFPLILLACSVNTPIDHNRSHLLRVASHVLCELGLVQAISQWSDSSKCVKFVPKRGKMARDKLPSFLDHLAFRPELTFVMPWIVSKPCISWQNMPAKVSFC